jgi:colanic acid/amylovoran biosynthesis glycosyltransferase
MRIGLVLAAVPGISETFFRSKIAGLQQLGFEVVLFAPSGKPAFDLCLQFTPPPVSKSRLILALYLIWHLFPLFIFHGTRARHFFRLERSSGLSTRDALKNMYLNSHILGRKLDWLHFGFATLGLGREHTAKAIGARMAVSIRGFDVSIFPLKYPGCYRLLWQNADRIHTISDDLLVLAASTGLDIAVKDIRKITPGVDVGFFRAEKPRMSLQFPIRILTVARLHWKKGLMHTLEALTLLKAEGVEFIYHIIGSGPELEALQFSAHQLGLSSCVVFRGDQPAREVKDALENADIYVQYSLSEGFGNALLEAQSMGLLCVASDAEGLRENIRHGITGWIVPIRKPDRLALQIREIIELSPEKQSAVRQAARQRIESEFNLNDQMSRFKAFYQE